MVDRWIHAHRPEDVIAALAPRLTRERRACIERVLGERLAGVTVVLEDVHDPHNGAAALRSVEGFGLSALHVVEPGKRARFSYRVTQGCQKWVSVQRHREVGACAAALRAAGFTLCGAVPGGALSLADLDVTRPVALVFGNEHSGLTAAARAACDATFGIPRHGFSQSFNLSVSVAVSVYDAARRRRLALGSASDIPEAERLRLRARWYAMSMDERAARALVARHVSTRTRRNVGELPRGC